MTHGPHRYLRKIFPPRGLKYSLLRCPGTCLACSCEKNVENTVLFLGVHRLHCKCKTFLSCSEVSLHTYCSQLNPFYPCIYSCYFRLTSLCLQWARYSTQPSPTVSPTITGPTATSQPRTRQGEGMLSPPNSDRVLWKRAPPGNRDRTWNSESWLTQGTMLQAFNLVQPTETKPRVTSLVWQDYRWNPQNYIDRVWISICPVHTHCAWMKHSQYLCSLKFKLYILTHNI